MRLFVHRSINKVSKPLEFIHYWKWLKLTQKSFKLFKKPQNWFKNMEYQILIIDKQCIQFMNPIFFGLYLGSQVSYRKDFVFKTYPRMSPFNGNISKPSRFFILKYYWFSKVKFFLRPSISRLLVHCTEWFKFFGLPTVWKY